jgi:GNAT superfamily N-acetyltransferase
VKAVRDAIRSYKTVGSVRTAQRLLQRVVPARIFDVNRILIIAASLDAIFDEARDLPARPELHHRWAGQQDFELLKSGGLKAQEVQKYMDAGGRAVLTTTNDELAGYYWAVPNCWDHYGWLRFRVAPNINWGGHNFVAPKFRGKGIAGEISRFAFRQLRDEGYVRSIGAIQSLNRSSLRVWSSPASQLIGVIFYIRLGALIIYRKNGRWGVGFYGGGRPLEVNVEELEAEYLSGTGGGR